MNRTPLKRSEGPLYKVAPVDGWYQWECPVCGDICEDTERRKKTCCHKGHVVTIAVVGTVYDGYSMVAEFSGDVC